MEEEEKYAELNINNSTMDTFVQSPVTINTQRKDVNVSNERRVALEIYAETIKEFQGFTIQSKISDSAYSDSEELVEAVSDSEELVDAISDSKKLVDAVSDPKSNALVATHTSDEN